MQLFYVTLATSNGRVRMLVQALDRDQACELARARYTPGPRVLSVAGVVGASVPLRFKDRAAIINSKYL